MPNLQIGQFAHINFFTLKPGKRDEFIEVQRSALPALGDIPGFRGSQLYRSPNADRAIQIAFFDDADAHRHFQDSGAFQLHRQRLLPLIEATDPGCFNVANFVDRTTGMEESAAAE